MVAAVPFGVLGYGLALAVITAGYALFPGSQQHLRDEERFQQQRECPPRCWDYPESQAHTGASAMGALFARASEDSLCWQ